MHHAPKKVYLNTFSKECFVQCEKRKKNRTNSADPEQVAHLILHCYRALDKRGIEGISYFSMKT